MEYIVLVKRADQIIGTYSSDPIEAKDMKEALEKATKTMPKGKK